MAPHTIDEFLPAPEWPAELCDFITWCLAWDPDQRPTATDAMHHQYFADALDPVRPKSAASSRMLGRKTPDHEMPQDPRDSNHTLTSRTSSWFRKSLNAKDHAPAIQHQPVLRAESPVRQSPPKPEPAVQPPADSRPAAVKRATWSIGASQYGAPMPFLPAIKPISPVPIAVHAQAQESFNSPAREEPTATLTRQLSMLSQRTSTSDLHRHEAERVLNGRRSRRNLVSPSATQKDGFFSHLRKRTRRWSGKPGMPATPRDDDLEAGDFGHATWHPTPQSMLPSLQTAMAPTSTTDFGDIDNALRNIQYRLSPTKVSPIQTTQYQTLTSADLKRHQSNSLGSDEQPQYQQQQQQSQGQVSPLRLGSAASSLRANQRAMQRPGWFSQRRRATNEHPQESLPPLDHALGSAAAAMAKLEQQRSQYSPEYYPSGVPRRTSRPNLRGSASTMGLAAKGPYPTPSPSTSTRHDSNSNGFNDWSKPIDIRQRPVQNGNHPFPTPPYDESALATRYDDPWAAAASATGQEAGEVWR